MIVKTFSGPSLRDALANVREAFGADAVILDTRFDTGAGGRVGSGERSVHITAAFEHNVLDQPVQEGPRSLTLKGEFAELAESAIAEAVESKDDPEIAEKVASGAITGTEDAGQDAAVNALDDVIARLGQAVACPAHSADQVGMTSWLATQPKLASEVIDAYATHIAESLPPFGPFLERDKSPLRVLVVGARGAGRTNAMFKACATRWRERQAQPNLLIISDSVNHAHEHLVTVSESCALTLRVATLSKKRFSLDRELRGADLFAEFVPDQTHSDLTENARDVCKAVRPDVVTLVVSATDAPAHWRRVLNRFRAFQPTHLIVTHWDEHQPWTEIAALAREQRLCLAYRISGSDLFDEIDPFNQSDLRGGVRDELSTGFVSAKSARVPGGVK